MRLLGTDGDTSVFPNVVFEDAMTAIAIVHVSDGFILAADGRLSPVDDAAQPDEEMLALIDDHQQKLFEIGDSQKNLAYAVVGCTIDPSGFDLIKVVESQIARIRHRRFGDCRQYLLTLGDKINSEINSAKQEGKIHAFPQLGRLEQSNAWKFARMEVAGYFDGRAILCRVEFFHYSRDRTEFSLFPYQHGAVLSGSSIVQRAMYHRNGDPVAGSRFSEYAKRLGSDPSLDDAEEYAVGYVKACCSPLAVELDPKCNAMGGHIHVAEITTAGLKWRVPPLSK